MNVPSNTLPRLFMSWANWTNVMAKPIYAPSNSIWIFVRNYFLRTKLYSKQWFRLKWPAAAIPLIGSKLLSLEIFASGESIRARQTSINKSWLTQLQKSKCRLTNRGPPSFRRVNFNQEIVANPAPKEKMQVNKSWRTQLLKGKL